MLLLFFSACLSKIDHFAILIQLNVTDCERKNYYNLTIIFVIIFSTNYIFFSRTGNIIIITNNNSNNYKTRALPYRNLILEGNS